MYEHEGLGSFYRGLRQRSLYMGPLWVRRATCPPERMQCPGGGSLTAAPTAKRSDAFCARVHASRLAGDPVHVQRLGGEGAAVAQRAQGASQGQKLGRLACQPAFDSRGE
eukprot:6514562-Prymnesium_polylepis.2